MAFEVFDLYAWFEQCVLEVLNKDIKFVFRKKSVQEELGSIFLLNIVLIFWIFLFVYNE